MATELSSDVIMLAARVRDVLFAEAAAAHPLECCGILLGNGNSITFARPAANVHPDPASHFEIDPQALIDAHRSARAGGVKVLGYYHSHPNGIARPSATDSAAAAADGAIWAIIAAGRFTLWRSGGAGFVALPYEVAPR